MQEQRARVSGAVGFTLTFNALEIAIEGHGSADPFDCWQCLVNLSSTWTLPEGGGAV